MTKQLFLLIVCWSIFQEIDSFLWTGQAQHSCQSSIFDFSHTLLFLCSTLISVHKLYLNVCLCPSEQMWMCVSSHSREALLWKRAHRWWRVYWLVGQAPSVSTRLKGDSSRPSYWHAELICSFWSITANGNYHCSRPMSAGRLFALYWFYQLLRVCGGRTNDLYLCNRKVKPVCLFCGQKWRCFSVKMF